MIRLRLFRRRHPDDPDLIEAKRHTAASRKRAQSEYRASVSRLADTQQVTKRLAGHNDANGYGVWLERNLRGDR